MVVVKRLQARRAVSTNMSLTGDGVRVKSEWEKGGKAISVEFAVNSFKK